MAKQNGGTGRSNGSAREVGVKAGSRSRDLASPAGATQPGAIEYQGSRPLFRGTAPGATKMGNEIALNVGKGGPGTGRTLYGACGTQGQHPNGNPNGKPKV
jgi:hypothetical protein